MATKSLRPAIGCLFVSPGAVATQVAAHLAQLEKYRAVDVHVVVAMLTSQGVPYNLDTGQLSEPAAEYVKSLIDDLSLYKLVEIAPANEPPMVRLHSASENFRVFEPNPKAATHWKLSRFSYLHADNGHLVLRNPQALCYLKVEQPAVLELFYAFQQPITRKAALNINPAFSPALVALFSKAHVIVPCQSPETSEEETDATLQQWDFHDLLFHSRSRIGRTEKPVGGTFRFKGILEPQPALKVNPWPHQTVALPVPDLARLYHYDVPFTQVLESRKSTRAYSLLPLTLGQLGEFLYRAARVRTEYANEYGDFISKPYPGGGANYETEFYITINKCVGIPRGMYYYDPKAHTLSLITLPTYQLELLLGEAFQATAMLGMPQVLITLANRFNRFNWKYTSMSYAAQLKNIGAIYQTMYLVATAMGIGACGLGTGNADRFSQITGLPYLEEGSVGEFMLGRPL